MTLDKGPEFILYTSGPRGSVVGSSSKSRCAVSSARMVGANSCSYEVSSRPESAVGVSLDPGGVG